MYNYPGQDGTATISIARLKKLEEKEQMLEDNKILIGGSYSCNWFPRYLGKDEAIQEVLATANRHREEVTEEAAFEKKQRLKCIDDIRTTKQNKPSLLDRIRWDFKNTPLADV